MEIVLKHSGMMVYLLIINLPMLIYEYDLVFRHCWGYTSSIRFVIKVLSKDVNCELVWKDGFFVFFSNL